MAKVTIATGIDRKVTEIPETVTLTAWEMEVIATALRRLPLNGIWSLDAQKQIESLAERFETAENVTLQVEE